MERQIKRQRIGLFVLTAALCGMVSMADTESEDGYFDVVVANHIYVKKAEGKIIVGLSANDIALAL